LRLTANGNIAAWQEAIVGSEVSGLRLTEVRVNVGDRVRKGQELAVLQNETVAAERDQTLASMAEAEALLEEARANAERARQIEGSGALSVQQIAQYLTAERTAIARLGVLKARLKADQVRLTQTQILAPDDGTISSRSATLGAVVQSGQELFRLIRRDRLEWRAELPAADLSRIKPDMPASITTANKSKVSGRVRMVAPTLDPQTRIGLVYVDINGQGNASPGMFASGEIEVSRSKVLTLPQSAVLLRDGYSYVFRVGPDKRVIQTKIGVGQRSGDLVAVTEGLEAGSAVVNTGVGFLADGDLVRLSTPAGTGAASK
jgi:RND family efflux transporter MFP subunit